MLHARLVERGPSMAASRFKIDAFGEARPISRYSSAEFCGGQGLVLLDAVA